MGDLDVAMSLWCAELHYFAVYQHSDAISHSHGLCGIKGDHQCGGIGGLGRLRASSRRFCAVVHRHWQRVRLTTVQQDLSLTRELGDPLLLASRQGVGMICQSADPDVSQLQGNGVVAFCLHSAQAKGSHFLQRFGGKQHVVLKH